MDDGRKWGEEKWTRRGKDAVLFILFPVRGDTIWFINWPSYIRAVELPYIFGV